MSAAPHPARIGRLVLASEVRQLIRDRRALFAAVVLPALLYPLIFWSQGALEESSREILEAREVNVALDFTRADPTVTGRARDRLALRTPIQLFDADASELFALEEEQTEGLDSQLAAARRRAIVQEILGGGGHILVTAVPHSKTTSRTVFEIYYDIKDDEAREAADRAEGALGEIDDELTRARQRALLGNDPAAGLDLEAVDMASAEDASGAMLGRLLPLLAVMVLLSGGSYAALAVFAGEREAGTLETLLVQPVQGGALVGGKFLAVLLAGMVTLVANLASIVACVALGLTTGPGLAPQNGGLDWWRFGAGMIYLPGCVLVCALLCLVCGRARTFREGQMTIFPVMILTALPTAVVLQPGVEFTPLLAAVPFTGPALALRDALRGELALHASTVMVATHALYAWLLLGRLGAILDAERVLSGTDSGSESAQRHMASRTAKRWGFIAVLAVYVIGVRLQSWNLEWGLTLTLWVLMPALTVLCARRARRARERHAKGWLGDLRLGPPAPQHLLGALLAAPGLAWAMREGLLPLLTRVLPMPQSALEGGLPGTMEAMGTPLLLFLFALSPGIAEELFFRGALLSNLRRDLSAGRALLWQALFFAATHASIYRMIPTGVLGLLFGVLVLRTRCLWPAIVLHAGYNALLVFEGMERLPWADAVWWEYAPWAAPIGLALFLLPSRRP